MDRAAAVCVLPKLLAAGFMFVDASPLPPAFNVTIILSVGLVVVYARVQTEGMCIDGMRVLQATHNLYYWYVKYDCCSACAVLPVPI